MKNCWSAWFCRSVYMKECLMKWGFLKDWNKNRSVLIFWTYCCRLYLIYEKSFEAACCRLNGDQTVCRRKGVLVRCVCMPRLSWLIQLIWLLLTTGFSVFAESLLLSAEASYLLFKWFLLLLNAEVADPKMCEGIL